MLSVIRYTAARCALSQVWLPPWLAYLLIVAIFYPPASPATGSLALGATLLLPISVWMCLGTINSESEQQRATMAAAYGTLTSYRIALLVSSLLAGLAPVPLSILIALVRDSRPVSWTGLVGTLLADIVAVALGTTIGSWVARPIIRRAGFAWLTAILVAVILVAVPHVPPLRLMAEILTKGTVSGPDLVLCIGIAAATLVAGAAASWASAVLAKR